VLLLLLLLLVLQESVAWTDRSRTRVEDRQRMPRRQVLVSQQVRRQRRQQWCAGRLTGPLLSTAPVQPQPLEQEGGYDRHEQSPSVSVQQQQQQQQRVVAEAV
jgi:hypothetical protein